LRTKAMAFHPDFVILGWFMNDDNMYSWDMEMLSKILKENHEENLLKRYATHIGFLTKLLYRSNLGLLVFSRLDALEQKDWFQKLSLRLSPRPADADQTTLKDQPEDQTLEAFKQLHSILAEAGIGCLVVQFPNNTPFENYAHQKLNDRVRTIAEQMGFATLDMIDFYRRQYPEVPNSEIFLDFCHLSPRGHTMVAEAIFQKLQSLNILKK
jgi:hypothetical protein